MNPTPSQLNHAIAASKGYEYRYSECELWSDSDWFAPDGKRIKASEIPNWAGDPAAAALLLDEMAATRPFSMHVSFMEGVWTARLYPAYKIPGHSDPEGRHEKREQAIALLYCEWNPAARAALEAIINEQQ